MYVGSEEGRGYADLTTTMRGREVVPYKPSAQGKVY